MRLFFKKSQEAVAFVDYEHWYYGYRNMYSMEPNVEEWIAEIRTDYNCKKIIVFGDFSEYPIKNEMQKLEKMNVKIVHTANATDHARKDFTDFIMLDYIYQVAAHRRCPATFIIFTGDGHFDSVMKYLKNTLKKKVIVYGVKRGFSSKLKSIATSYVEMPRKVQEQSFYYHLILNSLWHLEKKGKKATYWKTIRYVSEMNKVSQERLETAMQELMKNRYLAEIESNFRGHRSKVLKIDWDRLKEDAIWVK